MSNKTNILLVEDDPNLGSLLQEIKKQSNKINDIIGFIVIQILVVKCFFQLFLFLQLQWMI